jgi:hypothetical protein
MKIQLMSDLHLEWYRSGRHSKPEFKNGGADVLVLAGDINVGLSETLGSILEIGSQFSYTIYVAGNHEHYDGVLTVKEFTRQLRERLTDHPNIHVLDCSQTAKIDDVTFFGGTLWTNFRGDIRSGLIASQNISDFRAIQKFTSWECTQLFHGEYGFIKYTYEHTRGKKVIVSHFLPAVECISQRFRDAGGITSELNKYFANDLGGWIESLSDTTWLFGHSHDKCDIIIGSTRMVANPLGYPGENTMTYLPKIIEV